MLPKEQYPIVHMKYKNNKQTKYKKLSCPICKSNLIIKKGFRKTENRGLIQRFSCKNCSYRFVIDDGFFRMRNNPQKIIYALDLFYRGVSTRKVQFKKVFNMGRLYYKEKRMTEHKIICGDCIEIMKQIPDNSIDLIVTSPPYNLRNSTGNGMKDGRGGKWANAALQKGYSHHDDCMPHDKYVKWQRDCLTEMMRVMNNKGAILILHLTMQKRGNKIEQSII